MDYTQEETTARAEAALKRMLATPHQPHSEMKVAKRKAKTGPRGRPPKNEKGPATEPDPKS
jgi:hypothetical protein